MPVVNALRSSKEFDTLVDLLKKLLLIPNFPDPAMTKVSLLVTYYAVGICDKEKLQKLGRRCQDECLKYLANGLKLDEKCFLPEDLMHGVNV